MYLASAMQRIPEGQRWEVVSALAARAEDAGARQGIHRQDGQVRRRVGGPDVLVVGELIDARDRRTRLRRGGGEVSRAAVGRHQEREPADGGVTGDESRGHEGAVRAFAEIAADAREEGFIRTDRSGVVTGTSYVKIKLPAGWAKGEPLVVCEMVKTSGLTGVTPMPDGGVVTSRVQMSIEKVATGQAESGGEQAPPAGTDWTWC